MNKVPHQKQGVLTLCPTPLGNLGDITERTLTTLREADCVLAEDTRVTGRLLAAFDIQASLERMDEEMLSYKAHAIIERVRTGECIAFCSDAGMPGVSDPGSRLVARAREEGVTVEVLPGPSAAPTAYVASGFTCPRYYFGGFFPRKQGERQRTLEELSSLDAALVFYESPRRIVSALDVVARVFPLRKVAICRELTKLHEEIICAPSCELAKEFADREKRQAIKGEIVFVIDAPGSEELHHAEEKLSQSAEMRAAELLQRTDMTRKDVVRALIDECGIKRNEAYAIVQHLQ